MRQSARSLLRSALCSVALGVTAACALAQAHEQRSGDYTLRSSVVASTDIAAASAREYGIEPSPRRALVNVSLQKGLLDERGKAWNPVSAQVGVRYRGDAGEWLALPLREVHANGGVSYLGVFEQESRERFEFAITARPSAGGAPIELRFSERLPLPPR